MKNTKRTIGAVAGVAALSFAAGVYFAVYYGNAPKLEGGIARAAEPPDNIAEVGARYAAAAPRYGMEFFVDTPA